MIVSPAVGQSGFDRRHRGPLSIKEDSMRNTAFPSIVGAGAVAVGLLLSGGTAVAGPLPALPPTNCGPVSTPTGTHDVIAESTPQGRPGCTDAITVMTEYFQLAPTQAEGTARVLTVRGWRCMTDTGAQGSGRTACDRAGQVFHT